MPAVSTMTTSKPAAWHTPMASRSAPDVARWAWRVANERM